MLILLTLRFDAPAYRDALKEWTRERAPNEWAPDPNAPWLCALVSRAAGGVDRSDRRGDCLLSGGLERMPIQWAQTQTGLGVAL
jgi:hypothetical protein